MLRYHMLMLFWLFSEYHVIIIIVVVTKNIKRIPCFVFLFDLSTLMEWSTLQLPMIYYCFIEIDFMHAADWFLLLYYCLINFMHVIIYFYLRECYYILLCIESLKKKYRIVISPPFSGGLFSSITFILYFRFCTLCQWLKL